MSIDSVRKVVQIAVGLLSAVGLCWSLVVLPIFWQSAESRAVSRRIQTGESYRLATMQSILDRPIFFTDLLSEFPQRRQSNAFLRFGVYESHSGKNGFERTKAIEDASEAVQLSLQLAPVDSFFLLAAYTLETARTGYDKRNLRLLEASYHAGPREGWVSVLRNEVSLAIFPDLSAATQQQVLDEFAALVEVGRYDNAVRSLVEGWPTRDRLLASLAKTSQPNRDRFARLLADKGFDTSIVNAASPNQTKPIISPNF